MPGFALRAALALMLLIGNLAALRGLAVGSAHAGWLLGLPMALALVGAYRARLRRRRARLRAVLHPGGLLARRLTGRAGAAVGAALAVPPFLLAAGYFAILARPAELALALAASLAFGVMVVVLRRGLRAELRAPHRAPVAVSLALWAVAGPTIGVALWLGYAVLPAPHYADQVVLTDAVATGLAALPVADGWLKQALAPARAGDAALWWVASLAGMGAWPALVALLLRQALGYLALLTLAGWVILAFDVGARGNDGT